MTDIFETSNSEKVTQTGMKLKFKRKSKINEDTIREFYKREDISRVSPQKRYATKDGPGYLLQVSIKSANAKFNSENATNHVSW